MRFFSDAKKASLPLLVHLRCLKVKQNFMIAIKSKESEFNLPTSPANCTHPVSRIYDTAYLAAMSLKHFLMISFPS